MPHNHNRAHRGVKHSKRPVRRLRGRGRAGEHWSTEYPPRKAMRAVCGACRFDPGVLLTALGRYLPSLLSSGTDVAKLTGPFSNVRGTDTAHTHLRCMRATFSMGSICVTYDVMQHGAAPCALPVVEGQGGCASGRPPAACQSTGRSASSKAARAIVP